MTELPEALEEQIDNQLRRDFDRDNGEWDFDPDRDGEENDVDRTNP